MGSRSRAIEVRELQGDEYGLWDRLAEDSPQGTVFHRGSWLRTCSEALGRKLSIYGCFDKDRLRGGCSLFTYKLKGTFRAATSTPLLTPYGGVLVTQSPSTRVREQEEEYSDILKSLIDELERQPFDLIRMVNSPSLVDIRPFSQRGWLSKTYYSYYYDLGPEIEDSISKEVRNTARKAVKLGVSVERTCDLPGFYRLFKMTYERQGMKPPATEAYFERLLNVLRSEKVGDMWLATTATGELAAAEIFAWDSKRSYRWSAASHTELRQTGATSMLLREVLRDLRAAGFREVDLMAASTKHLAKFISSFNPRLVPLYSVERKSILLGLAERIYRSIRRRRTR